MAKLDKITIKGYKSISLLEDFQLNNLNVLIGANGAGKSNFISFFQFLTYIFYRTLRFELQTQGGVDSVLHFGRDTTSELIVKLKFNQEYLHFTLIPTVDNRLVFSEEKSFTIDKENEIQSERLYLKTGLPESLLASDFVEDDFKLSWKIYHFHDTSDTAKVKRQQQKNDNLVLKSDAENLAPYLYMLKNKYPAEYQRIIDTIRLVLPFFYDFVQRNNEDLIELEWLQKGHLDTPLKAHYLSDGSLRFICLMTLLLQPIELLPDTILIDEPELGLHPYAISILADVIQQVSEDKQIIISTQSVELLNHFNANDVIVVNQRDEKSEFQRLDEQQLADWLEDYTLGELWQSNLFGGRP